MWLLFHHNKKTTVVKDGKSFVETCPECGQRARFVEVELSENFGLFFIDLVGDKERKYRCGACGDVFDLRDQPDVTPAAAPTGPTRDIERERVAAQQGQRAELLRRQAEQQREHVRQRAEQQRREAEQLLRQAELERQHARRRAEEERRREQEEARANRIEDELAELKKRLGR
ncbi:MAG TPA: hypothetical protein VFK02_34960 [Kofleriaceae bacterium]|nr:hypothetical protein [Kofleriaceae bacterium]